MVKYCDTTHKMLKNTDQRTVDRPGTVDRLAYGRQGRGQ